jgi:hypothetical protein
MRSSPVRGWAAPAWAALCLPALGLPALSRAGPARLPAHLLTTRSSLTACAAARPLLLSPEVEGSVTQQYSMVPDSLGTGQDGRLVGVEGRGGPAAAPAWACLGAPCQPAAAHKRLRRSPVPDTCPRPHPHQRTHTHTRTHTNTQHPHPHQHTHTQHPRCRWWTPATWPCTSGAWRRPSARRARRSRSPTRGRCARGWSTRCPSTRSAG